MSGGADLQELAGTVRMLDRRTALLGGREITDQTPLSAFELPWPNTAQPALGVGRSARSPSWLAAQLYARCYVRPVPRARNTADIVAMRDFRASLSEANNGLGTWEGGWRMEGDLSREKGVTRVRVSRFGVKFLTPSDRVTPGPGGLVAGSQCQVRVPKERRELHPGYYFMLGDASWPWAEDDEGHLVRVYWNVNSSGAAAWVGAVSAELNRSAVPFRAKVLDSPDGHGRADSAVLYLPRDVLPSAVEGLAAILSKVGGQLGAGVPMFTRAVAPGLAIATDPGNGLSFGQHRCELVADGLLDHYDRGLPDAAEARYDSIARAFEAVGLDPARPYLAAGESDLYASLTVPATGRRPDTHSSTSAYSGLEPGRYLDAATQVGRSLCDAAYWNLAAGRCAWVGRVLDLSALAHARSPRPATASLEWRLYDGHAGVALFLAELFAQTTEERFWHAACGAFRTALHRHVSELRDARTTGGLHAGLGGVFHVARRIAALGEAAALADLGVELAQVGRLMEAALTTTGEGEEDDVVYGRAGLLFALLANDGVADSAVPIVNTMDMAVDTGRALVASTKSGVRLTGFAHGAAGLGAALLRLHARTRLSEFLEAGRSLLDWEDGLFDDAEGRWPDLREHARGSSASTDARATATWCNGAAGIGLSRLSAMIDDPDRRPAYARSAARALELVRAALTARVDLDDDMSLCHGCAGFIETLLVAGRALAEPRWIDDARSAADTLLRGAWSRDRLVHQVRTDPGLMLGVSGVGHQLLRLHAPDVVPGILALV